MMASWIIIFCIAKNYYHGALNYPFSELLCVTPSTDAWTAFNRYESPYWRTIAAARIQVAWRYRKRRLQRAERSRPSEEPDRVPTWSHYGFQQV